MQSYRGHNDLLMEELATENSRHLYLQIALEDYEQDHDAQAFLLAVRDVAKAQGGIAALSERTGLNRQSLYKALSSKGNPKLETLGTILNGLGFRLSIEALDAQPQS
jgi:probable addiction module antidote protein